MKKMKPSNIILLAFAGALFASCGEKENTGGTGEAASSPESPLASVFLAEEPAEAISVSEARKKANPGAELTVTGKIAGVFRPFTEGYASVVLGDVAMKTCDLTEDDLCETPWDACCADPEEVKAQRMTIQITDDNGIPVAQDLKGFNGLKEMDVLVVSGTVNATSTEENLILDVKGIYQKKS